MTLTAILPSLVLSLQSQPQHQPTTSMYYIICVRAMSVYIYLARASTQHTHLPLRDACVFWLFINSHSRLPLFLLCCHPRFEQSLHIS
jgi:hypothetical protein